MAAGASNDRVAASHHELFSAFDEIVIEVQRLERELFSERTLCEKLNARLKDLDSEEENVLEQTNALFAKREENFKKEVDVQAALDCITKTLQLAKERHAGLRHQLDRANNKAVEQNLRLTTKEEKYGALWDSYKAVYESMPLVMEVNRMTDLVKRDKIKLMQANYELRVAHNKVVQMDNINEMAKKVEVVKLAEVLCEKAASERLVAEMQRQMMELQTSVGRGMERKQKLLARPTTKRTSDPTQATLPVATVAAMPVASSTGQVSPLLNLRSVPQVSSLATAYSRQASLEIVRARYAKRSWPGSDESAFSSNESPSKLLATAANAVVPEKMNCALPRSQQSVESPSEPNGMEFPVKMSLTQDDSIAREVAKEKGVADSPKMVQSPVLMEHSSQRSQPTAVPMDQDLTMSFCQGRSQVSSPRPIVKTQELLTGPKEAENISSSHLQVDRAPVPQVGTAISYRDHVLETDICMPPAASDQSPPVPSVKSKLEVAMTVRAGTRTDPDERPIISGIPLQEYNADGKMAEGASQPLEKLVSPFTPGTIVREQTANLGVSASQTGVSDGNAATGSSGNDPEQCAEEEDNMDRGFCLSQDVFQGSQDELSNTQQSFSDRTSRTEYLKKLRQSPEFHYAPRPMFNRQESGSQKLGSSSPYFQALVNEANAFRGQAETSLQGSKKQDHEYPKEVQVQGSLNQELQSHLQSEQVLNVSLRNQQPTKQQIQRQQPQVKQLPNQTMQGQQPQVQQFQNPNLQVQSQQFGNWAVKTSTQQDGRVPTFMEGRAEMQQTQGLQSQMNNIPSAHTAAQMTEPNKHHNQNDFQHTKILVGNQGTGQPPVQGNVIAQATSQFGSQGNGTAQATSQFGSQGNGTAQATSQFGSQGNGTAQATSQFGSQGNGTAQATSQFGSQGNGTAQATSQFGSQGNGTAQATSQFGSQGNGTAQATSQGKGTTKATSQFGVQGNSAAQPTTHFGGQGNSVAPTKSQFGAQGNGIAPTTSQFGSQGNGTAQPTSQFGSQGNGTAQATSQFGSHNYSNVQTTSQFMHQSMALPSSSQAMSQDGDWYTPRQQLSQGTEYFETPQHSQGDARMEMGGGNFGESPLSAFPSPGGALTTGSRGSELPDVHDSSSNESFQFKSPCCSPPPAQPAGFGFMGAAPQQQQQVSMFGPPVGAKSGSGDVQEKPRSEAFNFNFGSNSSKPSIFKLF